LGIPNVEFVGLPAVQFLEKTPDRKNPDPILFDILFPLMDLEEFRDFGPLSEIIGRKVNVFSPVLHSTGFLYAVTSYYKYRSQIIFRVKEEK
jgi:hypothetical protein